MQLMKNCIADFLSEKRRYLDSCYFCSSSFFFFILDFFDHVHRYGFSSRSLDRRMVFARFLLYRIQDLSMPANTRRPNTR